MINDLQKKTCKTIVSIFETSKIHGDVAAIARVKGDTGGCSYGLHQASLASGSLFALLGDYMATAEENYRDLLKPFMLRVKMKDVTLNSDDKFYNLLKHLADDPHMADCQEAFFDRAYWQPAASYCEGQQLSQPLSYAVIYDSKIHGSLGLIHDRMNYPAPVAGGEENRWISEYLDAREKWMANHSNVLLHKAVYRPQTFKKLIAADNWELDLPLEAHGITITAELLG